MNRWLQTKQYTCSGCGVSYLHDQACRHACFECPMRPVVQAAIMAGRSLKLKAIQ